MARFPLPGPGRFDGAGSLLFVIVQHNASNPFP